MDSGLFMILRLGPGSKASCLVYIFVWQFGEFGNGDDVMAQREINSRAELEEMFKNTKGAKPKNPSQGRICPNCQQKMYRVFIKGVERWMGCACSKGRAHHYI
jgi:hypothetical protein